MVPTILLDLDGTLVDSAPGIMASCRAALRSLGHEPGALAMDGLIGPPIEEIMRALLAPYGDDRVAAAVAAYREEYGRTGMFGSVPYPGIAASLAALQQGTGEGGAHLYLATSKRTRFAGPILRHHGLADLFDGIYDSEEGGALDHKPALIAAVVARHGLAPARCIMVGDRRHDIEGARANGMRALGVLWGYGTRAELAAAGADGIVAAPADLPAAALAMVGRI